jgi:hypothetical protein
MSTSAGKFMLLRRVPPTLHVEMKVAAARQRMTLEAWCRRAFEAAVLAAESPGEVIPPLDEPNARVPTSV